MSFDVRAGTWDASDRRQALAEAVAQAIRERFDLESSMHLLDIGAGTGLLTRRLLPFVGKMSAVDTSAGMLERLRENLADSDDRVTIYHTDIVGFDNPEPFDGIVSSMTIHHIEDTKMLFEKLHAMLKPGGFIALADLAPEDGTFHDHGNEGVFHFGFEEASLKKIAEDAGFESLAYRIVHTVDKGAKGTYDIFLLTATKPPLR
ncbi:class I SAM-dependent methyltransferase [Hydrogenimonas sp.]|uniref:class I SAM-dependent DNA methyltransferase n=1 Tax=Hydrogenimonas sp. TaxID=2231112 RepID=UPI00263011F6|nr:class I SAM-dependent methyltransferase [Hydrogenimonas sp.]